MLFHKVHIDTMLMPTVNKFCYLIQAHCALSSWPEWRPLWKENEKTLGDFIFEDILCRWGGVAEIVTDNGPVFVVAAGYLSENMASITSRSPLITLRPTALWNENTLT